MLIKKLPLFLQEKVVKLLFCGKKKNDFYQRLKDGDSNGQQILSTLQTMLRFYKKKDKFESIIVEKILSNLYLGQNITQAMRDYVSGIEQIMLSTSSQIGLQKALDRCMLLEERKMAIRTMFISKMWGPVAKIIAVIAALGFLGKSVLPELFGSLEKMPENLNVFSQFLFFLVDFTNSVYAPLSLLFFGGLIVFFFFSLKRWTGKLREKLDNFTPYSLYRIMVGTSWLSSVSIMISSKISVEEALNKTLEMARDNKWLSERILAISRRFGSYSFGQAIVESGFSFPDKELVDEMEILAEQGVDSSRFLSLADYWAENGVKKVEIQIGILSTVTSILFYATAVVFILGIILLIQDISTMVSTSEI